MEVLRLVSKEAPLDCIACVILYNNPTWMIENVVSSFLDTKMNVKLYIIDNSPTPLMKPDPSESRVFYHFVGQNLGYGKAQNWCIRRCEPTKYFLVLNPDVIISKGTIDELCRYLDKDPEHRHGLSSGFEQGSNPPAFEQATAESDGPLSETFLYDERTVSLYKKTPGSL